jgi:hypothetical protein
MVSSAAIAVPYYDDFGALPEATFGGTGIPNDTVAVSRQTVNVNVPGATVTVGMNATQRYDNPPLTNDGAGTYFAQTGSNIKGPDNLLGALWNFNYFIDISGGGLGLADFQIDLFYDFDPAFDNDFTDGLSGFGKIDMSGLIACGTTCFGAGFVTPVNTIQGSENLLFEYLAGTPASPYITIPTYGSFDPNAIGEYNFAIQVTKSGWNIENVAMDVQVVPVPAAVWLFGSGLIGLVGIARRKNSV